MLNLKVISLVFILNFFCECGYLSALDDISDSNSTDVMEAFYNDGYDSGSDPLWCPEKVFIYNPYSMQYI